QDRRKRLTGVDRRAPSLRASAGGGQALRRPNGRAIDGVVHRDRGPRDPSRSREQRHRGAAKPPTLPPSGASLPARIWLPCGPCRSRRPLRLRFGVTAAFDLSRLDGHTIVATARGAQDSVDGLPNAAGPLACHGIYRLRSRVIAARVVCASHSVAWVKSTMVAPSARRSSSIIRASLLPSRGAAVPECRSTSSRLIPFFG